MMSLKLSLLAAGALFAAEIAADTCDTIRTETDIEVEVVGSSSAGSSDAWYWSTACAALEPSCILYPESTQDVVDIISALQDTDEVFAVKAGGHSPNVHFASVEGGPLIALDRLNEVTLDEAAQTVRVGPGNRWDDVIGGLVGTGYTAVGGRIGNVGVGGLLLGGGLSYLSAQHGWAANSVLEYDIVLANGTAVTASVTQNSDLFLSLRGGGNNYGIVTSFVLQAYPQGDIWGGSMMFFHSEDSSASILQALRDFAEYCEDEKAAVILVSLRSTDGTAMGLPTPDADIWILYTFYDAPSPPPGVFDNFTAIGPFMDTSRTISYHDLLVESNSGVVEGNINTMGTETLPLPDTEHNAEVLGTIYNNWRNITDTVLNSVTGVTATCAYQPFTRRMAKIAREKGGDLLDIDDDVDRIIVELNFSYLKSEESDAIDRVTVNSYENVANVVRAAQESGVLPDVYLPLFANDAYFRQDYFCRLKSKSHKLARKVSGEVDPEGLMRERTGGFKLSSCCST